MSRKKILAGIALFALVLGVVGAAAVKAQNATLEGSQIMRQMAAAVRGVENAMVWGDVLVVMPEQNNSISSQMVGFVDAENRNNPRVMVTLHNIQSADTAMTTSTEGVIASLIFVDKQLYTNFDVMTTTNLQSTNGWVRWGGDTMSSPATFPGITIGGINWNNLSAGQKLQIHAALARSQALRFERLADTVLQQVPVYHVRATIDTEELINLVNEINSIARGEALSQGETQELRNRLSQTEPPVTEFWIGQEDMLPRKVEMGMSMTQTATGSAARTVVLHVTLYGGNYNQLPIEISAPAEFIDARNVMRNMGRGQQ